MIRELTSALLMSTLLHAAEPQVLFNGKDFSGWSFDNIDPKVEAGTVWSVRDGILVCQGRPPGVIRSDKEFSNYELNLEWRWAPDTKPENSGVLIHASTPREAFVWPKSIEVQLAAGHAGDFWMIGEKVTVVGSEAQGRRWVKKSASAEKPPGEWNRMRIRCEGEKVAVWVNGTLMNEGTGLSATRGAICLQCEGGEIHFRKIELTPIE